LIACDPVEVETTWTDPETVDPLLGDETETLAAANEERMNTAVLIAQRRI
jgi:hypothetical protein